MLGCLDAADESSRRPDPAFGYQLCSLCCLHGDLCQLVSERLRQTDHIHDINAWSVPADNLPGKMPACVLMWKGNVACHDAQDRPQGVIISHSCWGQRSTWMR